MAAKVTMDSQGQVYVLVTGANSGLGFAICCRLIDEFLSSRPASETLTIIFTTRSNRKGSETLSRLQDHLRKSSRDSADDNKRRIVFQPENVDLTQIVTVRTLAKKLKTSFPYLDAIILNAGFGGFSGIDWPRAIWSTSTDLKEAATWPTYKLSSVGLVTGPQLASKDNTAEKEASAPTEPPLGEVFCANVFGHYLLTHYLMPLLSKPPTTSTSQVNSSGRIIWVSSIEPGASVFSRTDIQGLRSPKAYETSKRLTDLLALGSHLPSTKSFVSKFYSYSSPPGKPNSNPPQSYIAHPGICGTSIVPLPYILQLGMFFAFYVARWLGSPWHTVSPYMGAAAPVWLALSSKDEINAAAAPEASSSGTTRTDVGDGGLIKWGSATSVFGERIIKKTEVEGWGYSGVVGEALVAKGRKRGAVDVDRETRESFEEDARVAWQEMETLRERWEGLLDQQEKTS